MQNKSISKLSFVIMHVENSQILLQILTVFFITAYKISKTSEVIYYTRAIWLPEITPKVLESSNVNILITINNSNTSHWEIEEENKELETMKVNNKTTNTIIGKYGIVEDYRGSKVLSSRRMDLRRHTLTMVNVITDSNETKKHLEDRL